jgi:hypothetical protein
MPRYQEPKPFTFHISQASVGAYAEGEFDETSYQNSDVKVSHSYLFAGPAASLAANGSIYHPNFMTWQFNMDGAVGWFRDQFESGGQTSSRDEFQYLGRFSLSFEFLPGKPYHANAFVDHDHTFRDNDFFSRVIVDSWRYGGRAGWHVGKWDLDASYYHRDEDAENSFPATVNNLTATSQHTLMHEDVLTFLARNERDRGGTTLSYNWDRYTRSDLGSVGEGTDQSVSIGDNERFGAHDQARLNSTASFFHREALTETSDEFLAHSSLNIDHTDHLRTFYDFDYDHFSVADFNSGNIGGQAGVQHQLYESLNSTLFVHGSDYSTDSSLGTTDIRRLGGGWAEAYTKHFSEEHRLRVANTLQLDHTDQEMNTPHLVRVVNERHTFAEGGGLGPSFTLNLPDVVESTIVVTDDRDTQPPFSVGFDFRIVQNGSRTVIERLIGSRIGTNQVMHVSYNAAGSPSGSYNTFTESAEIRFDLWQNLVGVYGRITLSLNDAPIALRIQEVRAYTLGTDLTWRWLHTGAEYVIYDSTQSDYRSARFFQSLLFHPDPVSNIGLDFTEAWIDYINANRQEQDYTGIFRYHRALTSRLGLDADAGVSYRTGNGVDQLLATFRPSIKYVVGKLSVDAGYDYEYDLFLNNQKRQKHMFFLRMKRYF